MMVVSADSYPRGNSHKAFLGLTEAAENQGNFLSNTEQRQTLCCTVGNKPAASVHIQIHHHKLRFMKEMVAVRGEKKHAETPTHISLSIKSSRKSIDKAEKSER